ncbi:MAG: hypothetical protein IPL88_03815 [Rhizobiales bacterium]|nr:hypothetical protein [Hyphomicrobiales bacterium]
MADDVKPTTGPADGGDPSRRRRREAAVIDATATELRGERAPAVAKDAAGADAKAAQAETTAQPAPPPASAAKPAAETSSGLGVPVAALLGGVAGSAMTALILWSLQPEPAVPPAVLQRLSALETADRNFARPDAVAQLDKRVGAVEASAKSAAEAAAAAAAGTRTVEGVARSAEGLAKAASGSADAAKGETQRLAQLLANLPAPVAAPAPQRVDLGPVEQRLAKVEAATTGLDARIDGRVAGALQASAAAQKALETRMAGVEQSVQAGLKQGSDRIALIEAQVKPVDLAPLNQKLDQLGQRVGQTEQAVDQKVGAVGQRVDGADKAIAGLGERVAPLEAKLAETKSEARVAAAEAGVGTAAARQMSVAVAGQAIGQALERGAPYAAELTSLEALGVEAGKLAPLKPFAPTGAPTARALAQRFAPLAAAVAANAAPGEAPKGAGERFWGALGKMVQVRRTGDTGDDPASLAARIENALARGAVGDAAAAWRKLPGPAKTTSQDFGAALEARAAADEAARGLAADAFAALGKKP